VKLTLFLALLTCIVLLILALLQQVYASDWKMNLWVLYAQFLVTYLFFTLILLLAKRKEKKGEG